MAGLGDPLFDAALGTVSGVGEALAQQDIADFEATQKEIEADRVDRYGAEIVRAGNERAAAYSEKAYKFAKASDAALAQKSISLNSGLAKAIQMENQRVADTDLLTMKNKVSAAVLSSRFKAKRLRLQAKFDRTSADNAVGRALFKGVLKGATGYYAKKAKRAVADRYLDELKLMVHDSEDLGALKKE